MNANVAFVLFMSCTAKLINGQNFDHLGDMIQEEVRESLRPMEHLQEDINNEVRRSFEGEFHGPRYNPGRMPHFVPGRFNNFGAQIAEQVQQQVQANLQPVMAMDVYMKMKSGIGGNTVVTYYPSGRQFLIRNNELFDCSGRLTSNGECRGNLQLHEFKHRTDYCFLNNYNRINNQLCLSNGSTQFSSVNGEYRCESQDKNSTPLSISVQDYQKLCQDYAEQEYTYIANPNDFAHVQIPNENPYVKCKNSEPGICTFSERKTFF